MIVNRREFLATGAASLMLPSLTKAAPAEEPIAFFLIGDTHYLANKDATAKLDDRSAHNCNGLIDTLNKLPGTAIPKEATAGTVLAPRGVIHAGDCIDSGDKTHLAMQETEWAAFKDGFGLKGNDGRLKHPVYEIHGNHDSPRGDGLAVKKIIERNKNRMGVKNVSKNGVHYSWDWGRIHVVNLGIVVGQMATPNRKRRYAPLDSLDFLMSDLKENVGTSGRPVIITHHVDMIPYAQPLPVEDAKAEKMEWDPADVKGFFDAVKAYNIAAILYGHTHARNVFRWDGSAKKGEQGIPTFNVDNSAHFMSLSQGFFYFELSATQLTCREYQTKDGWETGFWTPQMWTTPVKGM
ncbi:metallophosphoesterase [soil metagenome]